MPLKRMSYKVRLHAASHKSPCTSSKRLHPKSDHISFLPESPDSLDSKGQPKSNSSLYSDRLDKYPSSFFDSPNSLDSKGQPKGNSSICSYRLDKYPSSFFDSPNSLDSKGQPKGNSSICSYRLDKYPSSFFDSPDSLDSKSQPKSNSSLCSDRLDNHAGSFFDQEQLNEEYFNVCEIALDSPRSLTLSQENDGKLDEDFLKEFNLLPCSVVLFRYNLFSEVSTKKSDKDLLVENGIRRSLVIRLERLKKSVINHWTHSLLHKHFKAHHSSNYVKKLVTMDCEYFSQRKKDDENNGEFCRKTGSTSHSLKFEQLKDVAHKTIMVRRNQLDLRHRISELIKKRERALKQKKRIYYEKDKYVLLNKEDVSKVKPCKIDLGLDCSLVSSSSMYRTCDSTSKEESIGKKGHKIFYKKNFYVFVPKETDGDTCREAVERETQCKVVPNLRRCSLSPNSMRGLFESINEGKKHPLNNRRTSCEEVSENISPSPDCISRISGSNYNAKSQCRRTSSNSPVSISNISGSINNEVQSTMQKRKIFYPDDHYVMVNHEDVNKIRTAVEVVLNKPRQKRIKAVHNSDANLIEEAKRNAQNCRVVLEDLNLSLHAMPQKFIIKKGVKIGQKKRKDIENRTVLENLEFVPLSLSKNSICRLRESTCEKAYLGQKRRKSSGNEYCVFVNRQCYSEFRMAVQNMEHCNVALDSNIIFFGSKETILSPNSVAVTPANSVTVPPVNSVTAPTNSVAVSPANSVAAPTNSVAVSPANSVAVSPANSVAVPPTNSVAVPPANSVAVPPANSVAVPSANSVTVSTTNSVTVSPTNSVTAPTNSVAVPPLTHRDITSFTNTHENCPDLVSSRLSNSDRNKLFSNSEHNSQQFVLDQLYPSSPSCNLSSDLRTTFSGGLSSDYGSIESMHEVSPQDVNAINQYSFPVTLNTPLSSPTHSTYPQSTKESMSPEGQRTYPQSTNGSMLPEGQRTYPQSPNESMLPEGQRTYPQSTSESMLPESQGTYPSTSTELGSSSQVCVTQELLVNQNRKKSIVAQYSSSQETNALSQNIESLMPTGVQCSPLTTNENCLEELFVEKPCVSTQNSTLSKSENYSEEQFGNLDSHTPCSILGSPEPCDSTQSSVESSESGNLTPAHVTKQDCPNVCIPSASPNPYSLTQNSPALTISGALTSCVTRQESPNFSTSPNPNSLTLTTSGALTPANVTIQDNPDAYSNSTSPNPHSLTQNSPALTVSGASVTRPESPNACNSSASVNPNSLILTTSGTCTPAHVTIQDNPDACSTSTSPYPYSLTQNSPALTVSCALTSCVTKPDSPNACNSSTSPNPDSLPLTTSGALTPAHVTLWDNPDACSTSASPNPYSLTQSSPAFTASGALTSCVTKPESPNACNFSASPNPNSPTLTTSGALTPACLTIQDSPDACSTSASPNPYSLTQNIPALTVSGALTSSVTRPESPNECNSSASPNPNNLILSTSSVLTTAHVKIQDSPDACSTSVSPNPYSLTQNSPALTLSGTLTSCVTKPESPNACNSSASPNPNSLTLTTSGAVTPAHVTIHYSPDACTATAPPNPYSLKQNSSALTVNGALTSCVTRPESPNASSISTAMDTDTEVDYEPPDSNVGRFKMDVAHEALDFSALNGNGEVQEIPNDTEHENVVKVRTNGVLKDLLCSTEEMDFSTEEEDCSFQFDRKSGIKLVTNGLWNGGIESDHSSSNTVIANKRPEDWSEWYM